MKQYFDEAKRHICDALSDILMGSVHEYENISPRFGRDTAERLYEYTLRGKMLRGGLVALGCDLLGGHSDAVYRAGAAMELFQSALLIHDDIMDNDTERRGRPSMHTAYARDFSTYSRAEHSALSLAICAADFAFFAAFRALSELASNETMHIVRIASQELSYVCVAQLQDVVNGASGEPVSEDDILTLYKYKTGRYTFSMPLAVGALLGGAKEGGAELKALENAGEKLGIVFQLKDDELGLFADKAELGKPIGADIRENKKTLHRLRLFAAADAESKKRLETIFGTEPCPSDMAYVRDCAKRFGIIQSVEACMRRYAEEAAEAARPVVRAAAVRPAEVFTQLMEYSLTRRA